MAHVLGLTTLLGGKKKMRPKRYLGPLSKRARAKPRVTRPRVMRLGARNLLGLTTLLGGKKKSRPKRFNHLGWLKKKRPKRDLGFKPPLFRRRRRG